MIRPRLPAAVCAIFLGTVLCGPALSQGFACAPEGTDCLPILGCVTDTLEIFQGRAIGTKSGPLNVAVSTGTTCQGTWSRSLITGTVAFACTDGREGSVLIDNINLKTLTFSGRGALNNGQIIEVFVGDKIKAHLGANPRLNGKPPACTTVLLK